MAYEYSKLRGLIREKSMTERDVAAAIGKSQAWFSGVFAGKASLRRDDILALCEVLEIPQAEIVNYFFCAENCENETAGRNSDTGKEG